MRPYYPAADLYRVVRDDGLRVDFMATIHGLRSFEGVRDRATTVEIDGLPIRPKPPSRRQKLAAVALESERALREMIRRWQALPPHRRTNFLRKRVSRRGSAL